MLIVEHSDSCTCQACTYWLADGKPIKEGFRPIYKVTFGYDGSNHAQSFWLCDVCLAEFSEKIQGILKAERDTSNSVILELDDFIRQNPKEGGFNVIPERKDDVKAWLKARRYMCEPSANGKLIHIEYWKK